MIADSLRDEFETVVRQMEDFLKCLDLIQKGAYEAGEWREARKTIEQAIRLTHVILNFKAALDPGIMPDIDTVLAPVTKKDLPS